MKSHPRPHSLEDDKTDGRVERASVTQPGAGDTPSDLCPPQGPAEVPFRV